MLNTPRVTSAGILPLRMLVIDDNRSAADALAKLLTIRGHIVETAYSGRMAIEAAPAFEPEVVLLDIGLPDMEGYDVAKALRASPETSSAVLIALTGYGQESDIKNAERAGFNHHLTKPAGLAEIEEILGAIA